MTIATIEEEGIVAARPRLVIVSALTIEKIRTAGTEQEVIAGRTVHMVGPQRRKDRCARPGRPAIERDTLDAGRAGAGHGVNRDQIT